MSLDCVLDASVGVKLFPVEPLSEQADALFAHTAEDPSSQLYLPDLGFVECTNILWKYVQWHGYPAQNAHKDVADLLRLPLHTVSTRGLVSGATALAVAREISTYDATYVSLSQQLSPPLVVADELLVCRLDGTSLDVRWLAEWPRVITGSDIDSRSADAP